MLQHSLFERLLRCGAGPIRVTRIVQVVDYVENFVQRTSCNNSRESIKEIIFDEIKVRLVRKTCAPGFDDDPY